MPSGVLTLKQWFNPLVCGLGIEAPDFKADNEKELTKFSLDVFHCAKRHIFLADGATVQPQWMNIAKSENPKADNEALKAVVLDTFLESIHSAIPRRPEDSKETIDHVFDTLRHLLKRQQLTVRFVDEERISTPAIQELPSWLFPKSINGKYALLTKEAKAISPNLILGCVEKSSDASLLATFLAVLEQFKTFIQQAAVSVKAFVKYNLFSNHKAEDDAEFASSIEMHRYK